LGLTRVTVAWQRAETLGRDTRQREQWAAAVARAVAPLPALLELSLPLLVVDGGLVSYKGPGVDSEVEAAAPALELLGGELVAVDRYRLPFSGASRALVWVKKVRPTPGLFPRRAGLPARKPLAAGGDGAATGTDTG